MVYEFKVIGKCLDGNQWGPDWVKHIAESGKFNTGAIVEISMKMAEYDEFVANHPELERYIGTAPAITFEGRTYGGGHGLETKQPDGFKEVLAKIGENHPASPLAERYRKNKTIKEVKTKAVMDKHRKKDRERAKEVRRKVRNKVNG